MTRISKRKVLMGIALAAGSLGWAAPASAQASRTWVSGEGDDLNSCARNNPCRTFAGALSKTATGGEINCLDPHSFGAVTITKSISIVCHTVAGVLGSSLVPNGITINVAATDFVFLSGLDINGLAGNALPGTNGIRILGGGTIHIQDSMIRGFRASDGVGLRIAPAGVLQLTVSNTTISDNGSGANGGGILIQPTLSGSARVTLRDVLVQNNANSQIRVDTTGNSGAGTGISLFVDDSQILGGTNGISLNQPAGTATITSMVVDSFIALCSGSGLLTAGSNTVRMRVSDTTITACGTGVTQGVNTIINTYGNNRTDGNGMPGVFTLPALQEN